MADAEGGTVVHRGENGQKPNPATMKSESSGCRKVWPQMNSHWQKSHQGLQGSDYSGCHRVSPIEISTASPVGQVGGQGG